jgi:hypothetical protein
MKERSDTIALRRPEKQKVPSSTALFRPDSKDAELIS